MALAVSVLHCAECGSTQPEIASGFIRCPGCGQARHVRGFATKGLCFGILPDVPRGHMVDVLVEDLDFVRLGAQKATELGSVAVQAAMVMLWLHKLGVLAECVEWLGQPEQKAVEKAVIEALDCHR